MRTLLFSLLFLSSFSGYAQDAWTQLNDFPFETYSSSSSSFVVGEDAYVAVREGENEVDSPAGLYVYDSVSDGWTFVTEFPSEVGFFVDSFVIENRVFYLGLDISTDISELWEFDSTTTTWEQRTGYPFEFSPFFGFYGTAFSINGLGYVMSSLDQEGISNFASYDPETDSWTERAPFVGPDKGSNNGFVIDSKAYMLFGNEFEIDFVNDLWMYDPDTDSWEQKESIPGGFTFNPAVFVLQDQAYVGLGEQDLSQLNTLFMRYNPVTDSWETIESPSFLSGAPFGFAVNNIGYVGVGFNDPFSPETSASSEVWRLDPALLSVAEENTTNVSIFPNPVTDVLFIQSSTPVTEVTVYTILGQIVLTEKMENNQLDVSSLSKGIYLLQMTNETGAFTQRLVKN